MNLFKFSEDKIIKIKKELFKSEKEIHEIISKNLDTSFNLEFVKNEIQYNNLRIDTLAFDNNQNTFVIIEYKNKSFEGLTDQGFAYKSLIKNHPEFFLLEFNNKNDNKLGLKDVDWSKTRILFISPEFTKHQESIDLSMQELPFELWRITKYTGNIISLESLKKPSETLKEKVFGENISIEKPEYTETMHLIKSKKEIIKIYNQLKEKILLLGEDIYISPQKKYVAFKSSTNFTDIELQKNNIKIHLNLSFGELEDPKNIARNVSNIGHYGNGDYEINFSKEEEMDYIMQLINQSYEKNK